jgi:hypothetical protein
MNIKYITAKFNSKTNILEIFYSGKNFHTCNISSTGDEWFGTNIQGKEVDFNFWEDDVNNVFVLTIYPIVEKNSEGFWSTNTNVFERISMEIE